MSSSSESESRPGQDAVADAAGESFWGKHRDDIILGLLVVYVILLGIGTVAELFDIRSILSWPIYR